jgi:ubiquinone/menaquinone biosynthesis C-methylase UbiE
VGDWQRLRYDLYSTVYDFAIGRGYVSAARRRSIELLAPQPGEAVVVVGGGTGLDLCYLPRDLDVRLVDFSPRMIVRAKARAARIGLDVDRVEVADAAALPFPTASFDAAVLHLILAVTERPEATLAEVARVVRPGGRAAVFDKFVPHDGHAGLARRALNVPVSFLFTDLTRRLGALVAHTPFTIVRDEPSLLGGQFRVALLARGADDASAAGGGHAGARIASQ